MLIITVNLQNFIFAQLTLKMEQIVFNNRKETYNDYFKYMFQVMEMARVCFDPSL